MLVCPRWEKVRRIGPVGVGPPLLLNRFRGHHVTPCAQREYIHRVAFPALGVRDSWLEPEHVNVPASLDARRLRRAMGLRDLRMPSDYAAAAAGWLDSVQRPGGVVFGDPGLTASPTGTNISITTTNIGTGVRLLLPGGGTVNNIYFFVAVSPTNNTLQYNISAGSASLPTTPATPTIVGPTNVTTAVGWVNISGLSLALAAATQYWAWLSDSAAPQGTSGSVRRNMTAGTLAAGIAGQRDSWMGTSTVTDYWAAAGNRTFAAALASIVLVFSTGAAIGSPFTAIASSASDTNEKGLRLTDLTAPMKLYAAYWGNTASNNLTGLNVYSGTTAPSGTGDVARTTVGTDDVTSLVRQGFAFATPPTLNAATTYHLTYTFSAAATTSVRRWQIGTGADANLKAAMLGGGNWYYARANGTTDFANDATDEWPQMLVEIEDLVAAAAGGGGMLVHPGTSGGLRA